MPADFSGLQQATAASGSILETADFNTAMHAAVGSMQAPLRLAIDRLESVISNLGQSCSTLNDRLQPVLEKADARPQVEQEIPTACSETNCDLVQDIEQQIRRLEGLDNAINHVISRLEI